MFLQNLSAGVRELKAQVRFHLVPGVHDVLGEKKSLSQSTAVWG